MKLSFQQNGARSAQPMQSEHRSAERIFLHLKFLITIKTVAKLTMNKLIVVGIFKLFLLVN